MPCKKKESKPTSKQQEPKQTSAQVLATRIFNRLNKSHTIDGISDESLFELLIYARFALEGEPALLNISCPVVIFGDIHGQFLDLLQFLEMISLEYNTLLFLGDYVDRGPKSLEVIIYLLCMKILYGDRVQLLRGNHETTGLNKTYGFLEECERKRNARVCHAIQQVFDELPLCARVQERMLCMHGGLSPELTTWNDLVLLEKPRTPDDLDRRPVEDLLWADPHEKVRGFQTNHDRNVSVLFGIDEIEKFCKAFKVDIIVRGHEVMHRGHKSLADGKICTIFSAPDYQERKNRGSVMKVSVDMEISWLTIEPRGYESDGESDDEKTRREDRIEPTDVILDETAVYDEDEENQGT